MEPSRQDLTGLLRSLGAISLALGVAVWLTRSTATNETSSLGRFLILAVPAVLLYALASRNGPPSRHDRPPAATTVLAVTAILLGAGALFAFLNLIGAHTSDKLDEALGFALSGLFAAHAVRRLRVPYAALLAGLAALSTWELVWERILPHQSASTARWLLIAAAALLLLAAAKLARTGALGSRELATIGGLAAVSAGVEGVITDAFQGVFGSVTEARSGGHVGPSVLFSHHMVSLQGSGWDVYLLVVSALLVWLGARVRTRGLGYVGGFGLVLFALDVGVGIVERGPGETAPSALTGWPLILLLVGGAGLAASLLFRDG